MTTELPNPNDSWARVELWRWQYGGEFGDLPPLDDMHEIKVPEALKAMAAATERGITSPTNCAAVMRYVAKIMAAAEGK